jgi:Bacterial Ig-like domain
MEIRAMDRRRFMPSTEGLETRALQAASSTSLANIFGFQVSTNLNVPVTFEQKELRIEHLPYYMEKILPGRFLPKAEIKSIQGDLLELISRTRDPRKTALNNYNFELRQIVPHESLTSTNLNVLNFAFGAVLDATQASPAIIANLQSNLYKLASQIDTNSPLPVTLATNDYTIVLQTILGIGRPMPSPILPKIATNEGIQANINHIKTPLKHPSFVGTYHFHTHIQIITPSGEVVGTVNTRRNNHFRVTVQTPLSPGVYYFRIRAYDDAGNYSHPSRLFAVKVVSRRHHGDAKS